MKQQKQKKVEIYFQTKCKYIFKQNGNKFSNKMEIYFPTLNMEIYFQLNWICLSGGADSPPCNEAEDAKTRRRRIFEAFVEH